MSRSYSADPLLKYKFQIGIPGLPAGFGFQKISGLSRELDVTEYNEGGFGTTHKLVGMEKFSAVTAEKGLISSDLYALYKKAATNKDYRGVITISLLDREGAIKRTWTLNEAWISKWEGPDLDSGSSDVAIEKITIEYEGMLD